ncbi:MAG: protease complex subunit PrcB family protein [Clostridia bacterium]|nr:protease complex subunit PrcB family protein [Clostridia bacterium]
MKHKNLKYGVLIIASVLLLVISGCSAGNDDITPGISNPPNSSAPADTNTTPPQGITVNDIKFEILDPSSLSDEIKNDLEKFKMNRGFYYWVNDSGVFTLFIGMGEKPTGGYSIAVESVEDNEGKTLVFVNETVPAKDQMVTQALTYPSIIIQLQGITDQFTVTNTDNETYQLLDLNNEAFLTVNGVYQGLIDNNSIEVKTGGTYMVFRHTDMALMTSDFKKDDLVKISYTIAADESHQLKSIEHVK